MFFVDKLEQLRYNASMVEERKKEKPELTKEQQKQERLKIKKLAYELEKENFSHIYIYYAGNKWWKVGGNSAQYLFHVFAPKVKRGYSPRILPDNDYSYVFKTGVISVREIEKFRDDMVSIGLEEEKNPTIYGNLILAFKLKEAITKEDLDKLLEIDSAKRQEINKVLAVVNSDPEIAAIIRELQKVLYDVVKKMKPIDRELVGQRILSSNSDLYIAYRDWVNGNISDKDGIKKMLQLVDNMSGYMLIVMENDILSINAISKYTFRLQKLREALIKRNNFKKD